MNQYEKPTGEPVGFIHRRNGNNRSSHSRSHTITRFHSPHPSQMSNSQERT